MPACGVVGNWEVQYCKWHHLKIPHETCLWSFLTFGKCPHWCLQHWLLVFQCPTGSDILPSKPYTVPVCTTCNVRKLWISLLKWWFYALEYNGHEVLFAWIAATVINSLKKHPGNSFQSILSTRWPQTGNHMKKCREGKHGLIQENRNHMVEGGKINKAVLLKHRIPFQFSSHLFSSSAFFIRDYSFLTVILSYSCKRLSLSCWLVFPQARTQQKWNFWLLLIIATVNWKEGRLLWSFVLFLDVSSLPVCIVSRFQGDLGHAGILKSWPE